MVQQICEHHKFKIETPRTVLEALQQDGVVYIDFFQIPIQPRSRKYLIFVWQNQFYQFRVLCFGLSTAPQVFTRVLVPIPILAHKKGYRLHRYLDDWLLAAPNYWKPEIGSYRHATLATDWSLEVLHPIENFIEELLFSKPSRSHARS